MEKKRQIGEWFIWMNIVFIIVQVLAVYLFPVEYLDKLKDTAFAAEVTILGVVVTVLAICFALKPQTTNKSEKNNTNNLNVLYTEGNRFWFIDCFRLALCDLLATIICIIVPALQAGVLLMLLHTLLKIFFVFHYYFKELFNREKKSKTIKGFLKSLGRMLPLFMGVMATVIICTINYGGNSLINFGVVFLFLIALFFFKEKWLDVGKK